MSKGKKKDVVREQPLTYEDYANLPDDGNRYELVDGVLEVMSPAPTPYHQLISYEIQQKFTQNCKDNYFIFNAPIDVIFSNTVVRQPDLVLIQRDRFEHIVKKQGIAGTPDLIVEILSPSSAKRDKESKLYTYERYGVPEYWIVDPLNEIIEQYVLDKQRYVLPPTIYEGDHKVQSNHVQCVAFRLREIMENIPPIPGD